MHKPLGIALLVLVGICAGGRVAQAAEAGPARIAEMIAPVIDDQTLFVGHVDLTNLDVGAALDAAAKIVPLDPVDRAALAADRDTWVSRAAAFQKAGARNLVLISSIADYPRAPFFLAVPIEPGVNVEALGQLSTTATPDKAAHSRPRRYGDVMVWGDKAVLARLSTTPPTARPEIATALVSVAGSSGQLIFVPPAEARHVVEEVMPNLPADFGGAASRTFTQGVVWAAIGVDLPPQPLRVRAVVQSASAEAAAALNAEMPRLWQALGKVPTVLDVMPDFAEVARAVQPKVTGDRLTLELSAATGINHLNSLLSPPLEASRGAARRSQSTNNLKQIGLGMHNYLDKHKTFPSRAIYSADGKPLLSWRVALLPWLGEEKLFKEFKLDEPWDSEHNRRLIERMPAMLRSPRSAAARDNTTYLVPVMPGAIFGGHEAMSLKQIIDGLSNTIMVVEADDDHAVVWTKPDDLQIDSENPTKGLASYGKDGHLTGIADGSVRMIEPGRTAADWKAWFTAAGKEAVPQ